MDIGKLITCIPKENIFVNEPMSKHTTFKVGGPAECFIKANTIEQVESVVNYCSKEKIKLTVIGNGSNILVRDEGIKGIVLKVCLNNYKIEKKDGYANVTVEAGVMNSKLAFLLLEEECEGYEFACGIPGTIGGAIKMNAGAYGYEIKDIIKEVKYIDLNDTRVKIIKKENMDLSYRHSIFSNKNVVIIEAKFKFKIGNKQKIEEKMEENMQSRIEKQPLEPSAGSTFKRGKDFITAKLIDECGLRGKRIGDAEVSTKHAGFIINNGNARASDILELINLVKDTVLEKTGKKIELEIEVL